MCGPDTMFIINATTCASFDSTTVPANPARGSWTMTTPTMPDPNPDMCVVRGITFHGPSASTKTYLLWCSLKNCFIGSLAVASLSSQSPNIEMYLGGPVPNTISFQLWLIDPVTGIAALDQAADGQIAVHLDFIKYRGVPIHA